ncbi:hypothetical protein SNE35_26045 [Paucibacter sp. R3-3]|uniref:Uncharacterized protein n=1 Tax=Roseateles agri TaxID=3098619 RepID=A0ABU5DRX4_9BURK|nr:hypothetical protein [Paucibacter sp. R3-3]MDY0747989.1 hypothetical protein [Paucibacter sp. R3-3]
MSLDNAGELDESQSPTAMTDTPQPAVEGFELAYHFHTGPWKRVIDLQVAEIQKDMRRARAEGRLVVYLSCPISKRGGGHSLTNTSVARHVERCLMQRWGEAFWILNPTAYQLESKAGMNRMTEVARANGIDLGDLLGRSQPTGGDYMRMWTRVLVENDPIDSAPVNTGQCIDAFYFVGPSDVQSFFLSQGETLTAGIEAYFARKFATDLQFRKDYSVEPQKVTGLDTDPDAKLAAQAKAQADADAEWSRRRRAFMRYYGLRASADFSVGSHDEWNIVRLLNRRRLEVSQVTARDGYLPGGDVGEQIAVYFDGRQVDPSSMIAPASPGNAPDAG